MLEDGGGLGNDEGKVTGNPYSFCELIKNMLGPHPGQSVA